MRKYFNHFMWSAAIVAAGLMSPTFANGQAAGGAGAGTGAGGAGAGAAGAGGARNTQPGGAGQAGNNNPNNPGGAANTRSPLAQPGGGSGGAQTGPTVGQGQPGGSAGGGTRQPGSGAGAGGARPGGSGPGVVGAEGRGNQTGQRNDNAATPAQPANPQTGTPATPATPGNPRARENTQDTPSRSGDRSTTNQDGTTGTGTGTLKQAGQRNDNAATPAQPGAGVPLIPATPSRNASDKATQTPSRTGDRGTTNQGGTTGTGTGTPNQPQSSPTNNNTGAGSPGTSNDVTQANVSRDALLRGLINANIQNVNVQASDLININNSLNNTQVQALIQALNTNPQASANAQALTRRLRESGTLQQGQRVLGLQDGKVFVGADQAGSGSSR